MLMSSKGDHGGNRKTYGYITGIITLLIQLDLSSAFDTLVKDTLLRRLQNTFGIDGIALNWIRLYLQGHYQFVRVGGQTSVSKPCLFGVLQGSVHGQILFTVYIAPIAHVVAGHNVSLA